MLMLQNVKIKGMLSFRSYFDFQAIYKLLRSEDAYMFYDFGRNCLVNTGSQAYTVPNAKIYLFGSGGLNGSHHTNTGALRLLQDPALCLEETIPMRPDYAPPLFKTCEADDPSGSSDLVVFDNYYAFRIHICYLFKDAYDKLKLNDPAWEQLRKSVEHTLDIVTENGKRRFSPEAATELYLYFLLHALACISPDKKESLSALKADLDQLCPVSVTAQRFENTFALSCDASGSSDCPLAYYDGSQNQEQPLNIVEFTNPKDHPVTVTVKDTVLTRVIPAKKSLYALRKGGQLVCFLPRFRMDGKIVTYVWEGNLYNEYAGIREQVKTAHPVPVSWARSNEYGTFIVDTAGKLDETASWPDIFPEKPIVMVDTCALDYGMLFADGTVESQIRKRNWKNLISIALGLNSAAAINSARQVVLHDGTLIQGIQAAEVRTYNTHYICMDASGKVQTDTGLRLAEPAYGIAVHREGFAVAFRNCIKLFDFTNQCRRSWNIANASELEVGIGTMAYYDAKIGEVVITDL